MKSRKCDKRASETTELETEPMLELFQHVSVPSLPSPQERPTKREQHAHSTDLLDRRLPRVDEGAAGPEVGRSVHEGERPLAAPARPGGAPAQRPGVLGHEPRREGVAARGAPHFALGALCRLANRVTTSRTKQHDKSRVVNVLAPILVLF